MAAKSETAVRTIGAAARMQTAAEAARRAVADTARVVSEEVRESFRAWVERNFFNARAGRIGGVSYARAGELDDAVPESGPRGARREARGLWYAARPCARPSPRAGRRPRRRSGSAGSWRTWSATWTTASASGRTAKSSAATAA